MQLEEIKKKCGLNNQLAMIVKKAIDQLHLGRVNCRCSWYWHEDIKTFGTDCEGTYHVNKKDEVKWFKYCPYCGAKITYS